MFSHVYSPPPNICEILHMKNKLSNIHHAQVTDAKLEPRKGFGEGGAGAGSRGKAASKEDGTFLCAFIFLEYMQEKTQVSMAVVEAILVY